MGTRVSCFSGSQPRYGKFSTSMGAVLYLGLNQPHKWNVMGYNRIGSAL